MDQPLLTQVGFLKDKTPFVRYYDGQSSQVKSFEFGSELSLEFDTDSRYCIGWYNITTGENHPCPNDLKVDGKYEQCSECQALTGFNPAFYNSDKISDIQAAYNTQPHFVYLAYFSEQDIKVGITHAGRDLSRLLEQGARAAIKLETFPSANVARQYEADISSLGFLENVKQTKKIELLSHKFDIEAAKTKLEEAKAKIEAELQTEFANSEFIDLNSHFFKPNFDYNQLTDVIDLTEQAKIAGQVIGQVGAIMICQYQEFYVALPLKKFTGYHFRQTNQIIELDLPTTQFSLF